MKKIEFIKWCQNQEITESVAENNEGDIILVLNVMDIADNEELTAEELLDFNVNINKEVKENLYVSIDHYLKVDDSQLVCLIISGFKN